MQQPTHGGLMTITAANATQQQIDNIISGLRVKGVVCDDDTQRDVVVFSLTKGGYLVSVDGGDYAYWTHDLDVALRMWMEYQEDIFWKEAFISLGGSPEGDEYIILHSYDSYDGH